MGDNTTLGGAAKRGSSGAEIQLLPSFAWKTGPTGEQRVWEQGEYIRTFGRTGEGSSLPEVTMTHRTLNGYGMEMLDEPQPLHLFSAAGLAYEIFNVLERDVWCHAPDVAMDHKAHIQKLMGIVPTEDWDDVYAMYDAIMWDRLRACKTHGDPTFDNVMFRRNRELVLIDPIPPTTAVPSLAAVDTGKILQSCLGFESARYDIRGPIEPFDAIQGLCMSIADDNEWMATRYWCVVHLYRAIPYMPEEVKPSVLAIARDALTNSYYV